MVDDVQKREAQEKYAQELDLVHRLAENFSLPDVEVQASAGSMDAFIGFGRLPAGTIQFTPNPDAPDDAGMKHAESFAKYFNTTIWHSSLSGHDKEGVIVPGQKPIAVVKGNVVSFDLAELKNFLDDPNFSRQAVTSEISNLSGKYSEIGAQSQNTESVSAEQKSEAIRKYALLAACENLWEERATVEELDGVYPGFGQEAAQLLALAQEQANSALGNRQILDQWRAFDSGFANLIERITEVLEIEQDNGERSWGGRVARRPASAEVETDKGVGGRS